MTAPSGEATQVAEHADVLIVGAGAAGLPAAIFASRHGAKAVLADAAPVVGGTFHISSGQMSAAGTRLQAAKGIVDSPDEHFRDVMRISRGTANPTLVRLAVDHAAETLHWLLDLGLEVLPEHPVVHHGHEPYGVARTYWAAQEGRALLELLTAELAVRVEKYGLDVRLETRLRHLTRDGVGLVATFDTPRGPCEIAARNVVLASGGYTADPELFSELSLGRPLHGGGWSFCKGDGLVAARALGATVSGQEHYLPTFAGVEEPGAHGGVTLATQTYPQFRQPWEIYVDQDGRRFVQEDEPSPDLRERALLAQPEMAFWALFDARIQREAPSFFLSAPWAEIARRFENGPNYRQADSLAELAQRIGADPEILATTVDDYNTAVLENRPDPLGRQHRPLPVAEAPFYAVRHLGWSIVGFAGLSVDDELRVTDAAGDPIPGLYAAGEVLGLGATSGNAFNGGMSVTPAMTFGRILGERLGRRFA